MYAYQWILSVNYRPDQGFFAQFFQWRGDAPSRVHVIRKSDGQLLTTINTTAVFVTHQVCLGCAAIDKNIYVFVACLRTLHVLSALP